MRFETSIKAIEREISRLQRRWRAIQDNINHHCNRRMFEEKKVKRIDIAKETNKQVQIEFKIKDLEKELFHLRVISSR